MEERRKEEVHKRGRRNSGGENYSGEEREREGLDDDEGCFWNKILRGCGL